MNRFLAAALLFLSTSLGSSTIARAEDRRDVQAYITAAENVQGHTNFGVFASLIFIEKDPYAWVSVGPGVTGDGSMDYILSRAAGSWKILGQGGGVLGVSEMVGFGVPLATAKSLEGRGCPGKVLYYGDGAKKPPPALDRFFGHVHVVRYGASPALYRLVAAKGPEVLPARTTVAIYEGRKLALRVVEPLYLYACVL